MSKLSFSNSKFSVSDKNNFKSKVGWAFSPTLKYCWGRNPNLHKNCDDLIGKRSINNCPCHPELAAPLVSDEKEAYKGGGSQSISGSCYRQKCSVICTQKSNVGQVCPTYNNILLNTKERSVIVSCLRHHLTRKAAFTLAEVFSPYYLSPRRAAFTLAEVFSPYYLSPRRAAFTLAEVLITLGIIGVVAAMTLPSLVANYKEKQRVTQLKKSYSVLQQAFLRAVEKHGEAQYWELTNTDTGETDENGEPIYNHTGREKVLSYFAENLNTQKPTENLTYKSFTLDGGVLNEKSEVPPERYLYLNDNSILMPGWVDNTNVINNVDFMILFPECLKRGCTVGVDIFYFKMFYDKGFIPSGALAMPKFASDLTFENSCNRKLNNEYNGRACTAWVIYNENMDYLHCDDLSWSGKHKCK